MTTITQTITALPVAPDPFTMTREEFNAAAAAYVLAQRGLPTEVNTWATQANTVAGEVNTNATAAALSQAATAASAALVTTAANAQPWVSGNTYSQYVVVVSPANGRLYRKATTNIVTNLTVDPSTNTTDWAPAAIAVPVVLLTAQVTQALSGGAYAFTNSTTQGAATNIALTSKTFNNAAYTLNLLTLTLNATMGVDGNTTATKLVETNITVGVRYFINSLTGNSVTVPYASAVRAKNGGRNTISLQLDDGGANGNAATFNLTTGAMTSVANFGNGSGATATCTYEGNGWWDCRLTGTPSSSAGTGLRQLVAINSSASYAGDGVSGVFVDDMQVETGATTSSRIVTAASPVTRASGVVYPQRLVGPLAPLADAVLTLVSANGSAFNVFDPNGSTFMGDAGPVTIDSPNPPAIKLQFVNSSWRIM